VKGSGASFSADLGGSSIIQVRTLKTEVEKGFARTAFDRELVDPKTQINLANRIFR